MVWYTNTNYTLATSTKIKFLMQRKLGTRLALKYRPVAIRPTATK